jgi:hypothetical protein
MDDVIATGNIVVWRFVVVTLCLATVTETAGKNLFHFLCVILMDLAS